MFEMKIAVWRGSWRFILRYAGRVRVLGPGRPCPIEAWNTWLEYRGDAIPEALGYGS